MPSAITTMPNTNLMDAVKAAINHRIMEEFTVPVKNIRLMIPIVKLLKSM